jgi:hypothetical protein
MDQQLATSYPALKTLYIHIIIPFRHIMCLVPLTSNCLRIVIESADNKKSIKPSVASQQEIVTAEKFCLMKSENHLLPIKSKNL